MEYFRCNIIRAITALLIMVVSVQGGMFEYILDTQTTSAMNMEEALHYGTTECEDTENESNDECCLRRVKKHSISTTLPHFAHLYHPVKRSTEHIVTPITCSVKTSRPLSTLFCTFLIWFTAVCTIHLPWPLVNQGLICLSSNNIIA